MRQHVAPAMSRFQLNANQFTSPITTIEMLAPLFGIDPEDAYDYLPMPLLGGYWFGASTYGSLYSGIFSPHQIVKPGKDTVDLKCHVWWMGNARNGPADPKDFTIGWALNMQMHRDATPRYAIPTQVIAQSTIHAAMGSVPAHPLLNPTVASYDADGHIDWKYDIYSYAGDPLEATYKYPIDQWAVGYERQTAAAVPGDYDAYPLLPLVFYKTPVYQLKKVGGRLVQDDVFSFRNFSSVLDGQSTGVMLSLYRIKGAADGEIVDGRWGTDNNVADFTADALDYFFDSNIDKMAPIFVGMEFEII